MVKRATESQQKSWSALPSRREMGLRRIASFVAYGLFLSILMPFAPFTWLFSPTESTHLFDNFMSPPLLLGGIFAQYYISTIVTPIPLELFTFRLGLYKHSYYWHFISTEILISLLVLLVGAKDEVKGEWMRRVLGGGWLAGIWVLGWEVTPKRVKNEGWEIVRSAWVWMAWGEVRRGVSGGRGRGMRRW